MNLDKQMIRSYAFTMLPCLWKQMELLGYLALVVSVNFDEDSEKSDSKYILVRKGKYAVVEPDMEGHTDDIDDDEFKDFKHFPEEPLDLYALDDTCAAIIQQCSDLREEINAKTAIIDEMESFSPVVRKVLTEKA